MTVRFVARGDDGTLALALARVGVPAAAIDEGRVFVDRRRAERSDAALTVGQEIVVEPAQAPTPGVRVLGEFRDLYAVEKPVGLATEPDRRGGASLVRTLGEILRAPVSALHAVTRLDVPVSGIVVVARGHAAVRRAEALKRAGRLGRRYVALVEGRLSAKQGTWDAPVGKGPRGRPAAFGGEARAATTDYEVIAESPDDAPSPLSLLLLEPRTGRPHQLRVHAALAGTPLLGDVGRGGASRVVAPDGTVLAVGRVALHACAVAVTKEGAVEWSVASPPPEAFADWFRARGGDPGRLGDPRLVAPPRS